MRPALTSRQSVSFWREGPQLRIWVLLGVAKFLVHARCVEVFVGEWQPGAYHHTESRHSSSAEKATHVSSPGPLLRIHFNSPCLFSVCSSRRSCPSLQRLDSVTTPAFTGTFLNCGVPLASILWSQDSIEPSSSCELFNAFGSHSFLQAGSKAIS